MVKTLYFEKCEHGDTISLSFDEVVRGVRFSINVQHQDSADEDTADEEVVGWVETLLDDLNRFSEDRFRKIVGDLTHDNPEEDYPCIEDIEELKGFMDVLPCLESEIYVEAFPIDGRYLSNQN